jgi:hypothetical protein
MRFIVRRLVTSFRQRQTGVLMGTAKIILGNVSPYINWVQLALVGIMSFYTTISPVFFAYGISLPFWVFCLVLVLIVVVMALAEWSLMMPSYYRASNIQAWEAGGPIRDIQEACYNKINDVDKRLENTDKIIAVLTTEIQELRKACEINYGGKVLSEEVSHECSHTKALRRDGSGNLQDMD